MATTITIPSPSAFLDSPVVQAAATPKLSVKSTASRQSSSNKRRKTSGEKEGTIIKPKQTKSRDGCQNCKEKRLKCDETKPSCVQCEKKGVVCKGYKKTLKWRPQEDAFRNKSGSQRPRKNSSTAPTIRQETGSPTQINSSSLLAHAAFPATPREQLALRNSHTSRRPLLSQQPDALEISNLTVEDASPTPSLINDSFGDEATPQSAKTTESNLWLSSSPRIPNTTRSILDLETSRQDGANFLPEDFMKQQRLHNISCLNDSSLNGEKDIEEVIRGQDPSETWLVPMNSPGSSATPGSSTSAWIEAFAADLWAQPSVHHDSEEALILRFDKQTCSILSIKDGPSENPWRTMLWPLARDDAALRHAITSLTAFHASKESPKLRIKGMEHMDQSLQLLSRGINSMPLITSLATTLVLAFCESWDMLISTGIQHLRGASHLVTEIMAKYWQRETFLENEPRLGFLCRTWVYMDVIARLTSLEGDNNTDFDVVSFLCQPAITNHELDPLMGCASTLFPTIGRVADLVREVRQRTQSNSLHIISRAKDLKSVLERWRSPVNFTTPEDHWTEVEQGLWTAEAYRGATLLYLLQAVPEISYDSVTDSIAELAKSVLTHIANVPVTSGMVIIHIFPLLAAGCEASDEESRTFVIGRWHSMMQRMKIQNLDKCLDVVKEVWDRRDHADLERQRRQSRLATSKWQTGCLPQTIMERQYSSSDDDLPASTEVENGRAVHRALDSHSKPVIAGSLRRDSKHYCNGLDIELTVRGRQHWAGVMKDLQWEGKFKLGLLRNNADVEQY
ncbi:hypothetical protein ACLMJK_001192 [Lecanora helva]